MKTGPRRTFNPDPKEIEDLYQRHSMREIAKLYGVGETVVFMRIKEHGIVLQGFSGGHRSKSGKVFSDEHKAKISASKKGLLAGDKNPGWKGGISKTRKLKRNSREYKEWRSAVFARDGFVCQLCAAKGEGRTLFQGLHAHHVVAFAVDPSKAFDVANGQVVCHPCHSKLHGWNVTRSSRSKTG